MNHEFPKEVAHGVTNISTASFCKFFLPQITFVSSGKPPRTIRDALRDLVPFGQFKKCEKHLWKNVTFSKVASASM